MSSILINNLPHVAKSYTAKTDDQKSEIKFLLGYEHESTAQATLKSSLTKLFSSLLVHEKIYISSSDLGLISSAIGINDTLALMRENIFSVIGSAQSPCISIGEDTLRVSWITPVKDIYAHTEAILKQVPTTSAKDIKQALYLMEYNLSPISDEEIIKKTRKELEYDLSNSTLRSELRITTESIDNVHPKNVAVISRLTNLLNGLLTQEALGISDISLDGYSHTYLNRKISISQTLPNASTSAFERILEVKAIPDILNLYLHKTISIEDIISLRNSISGKIFRKWYESTDYNQEEIIKTLVKQKKEKGISKFIRFLYPNIAGIVNPILGPIASAADSFIIEKLLSGWSPSLFLDDTLKKTLDIKIEKQLREQQIESTKSRFGDIRRNDVCPCGSGKKFKKCHGSNL
ncbi:SEC-C domain-containing protein [Ectopseudomonas chengduensis]|nr:SEC-C domain-containing protein [Pseudomonas chengduensis]WKC35501.1 SEC-C domain-containing protein [Pseudomonas chengduensis]